MMTMIGERVLAVRDGDNENLYVYGEGIYVGDLQPPKGTPTPLGEVDDSFPPNWTNPCIRLDSGHIVWGCQCW
jgi:hypothetical protein